MGKILLFPIQQTYFTLNINSLRYHSSQNFTLTDVSLIP
jgi:hypothetical protein